MTVVTIHLSPALEELIKEANSNKEEFILEAVKEKLEKEKQLTHQLKEGYQSTKAEDQEINQEFDKIDFNEWPK